MPAGLTRQGARTGTPLRAALRTPAPASVVPLVPAGGRPPAARLCNAGRGRRAEGAFGARSALRSAGPQRLGVVVRQPERVVL